MEHPQQCLLNFLGEKLGEVCFKLLVRCYLFLNVGDLTTGQAELARRVKQPTSKLSFLEPLPPELLRNICSLEVLAHLESFF